MRLSVLSPVLRTSLFGGGFLREALFSVLALGVPSQSLATEPPPCVAVRQEALPVRHCRDRWSGGRGTSARWTTDGAPGIDVSARGSRAVVRPDHKTPKSPLLPRVVALVAKTDCAIVGGTVEMTLEEDRFGLGREPRVFTERGPWGEETFVEFDLPSDSDGWHLAEISFSAAGETSLAFRLLGVDAVTLETPAEALRIDVETGNDMRLVRREKGETPILLLHNPTEKKRRWSGGVEVTDYFGTTVAGGLDVAVDSGETAKLPIRIPGTMGIQFVKAHVSCEGTEAVKETRFAVVPMQNPTPPQPEDEFRIGVNWHVARYTPEDRRITADAAVAIGAKLMRGNLASFADCEPKEGVFDWVDVDGLVSLMESHGIAIDAIFTGVPDWARSGDPPKWGIRPCLFGSYASALARRYGKRIAYYEMGNEWDMKHIPLDEAVRQFREVSAAIKAECPGAKVIPPGFAAESSVRHPASKIRSGFQEGLMEAVNDICDAHPVHIHSPYREFAGKVDFLLKWRAERGVTVPWYANETAVSCTRLGETLAAETVWRKILHAWSLGSADYIWYNLRGTGWNPKDPEQGYGLFTADYKPRATAAAYAALTANFGGLAADGVLHDGKRRRVMRFTGERGGRRHVAIAGWDELAAAPMPIRISTDGAEAWTVDLMGNRRPVEMKDGAVAWPIMAKPSAIFFFDATFAEPDASDLAAEAVEPVLRIVPMEDFPAAPDLVLKDAEQVYEIYEAVPDKANRTWRWWGDLAANVRFARRDGKVCVRIDVEDDIHAPNPDEPLEGDAVLLRIGGRTVTLFDGASVGTTLRIPTGKSDFGNHYTGHTVYGFTFDPTEFGIAPGDDVPFNIRIFENDGEGPDGWIEWRPFDDASPVMLSTVGSEGEHGCLRQ